MRSELAEPIRDQERLRKLLPLAEQLFLLHEAGHSYADQLKQISRIVGRIVDVPTIHYAFGSGDSEHFARHLLIDWSGVPRDLDKQELLELLNSLCNVEGSLDRQEYWLKCLEINTGEPELTNLIYWRNLYRNGDYDGRDLSSAELLDIALLHGNRSDA